MSGSAKIIYLAAGLILSSPFIGWAQCGQPQRLVIVAGEAQVQVVPDEVVITLGVETDDKDLSVAKKKNDEVVKKVIELAKEYKIDSKHIQTDYINIEPRYEHDYTKRNFLGYFVRKTIAITLKDVSRFEEILSAALENGVNYVHGVQFRTTELRKYRDQARILAIKAAKEKAENLSKELGQKLGKPYSIQEAYSWWGDYYNRWWGSGWSSGMSQNAVQNAAVSGQPSVESSLALGQINVNANVNVSFEIE